MAAALFLLRNTWKSILFINMQTSAPFPANEEAQTTVFAIKTEFSLMGEGTMFQCAALL